MLVLQVTVSGRWTLRINSGNNDGIDQYVITRKGVRNQSEDEVVNFCTTTNYKHSSYIPASVVVQPDKI